MKPLPVNSYLNVLRLDVDAVDEHQEDGSDYVWGERGELLRDLTPSHDQSLLRLPAAVWKLKLWWRLRVK